MAVLPGGRRTKDTPWGGEIEMYDRGRFSTVTGDYLDGTPRVPRNAQLVFTNLYRNYFSPEEPAGLPPVVPSGQSALTDDQLIAEADRIHG